VLAQRALRRKILDLGPWTPCKPREHRSRRRETLLPTTAAQSPDRRVLHRANALKEAAEDTRPCERNKAIAEKPISRGHTPSTLDLGPELAAATDGRDGNEPDPTSHLPQNQQPTPHLGNKSRRPIAPHRQRAAADELLNKDSTKGDLPPRARRRRRSEAPTGRGRVREDLFRHGATATASTTPPGTETLTLVPNLQRRTERRRSPTHPRAQRPPEAEGSGDLAGENSNRFPLACLNCWEERVRETPHPPLAGDTLETQKQRES